jgi:glycosyltransferase involved in cell wall biosynthesis
VDDLLVSICIPAYNHEKYVVQALDSVLSQNYPQKEIVIINDGSSDSTADRIESWKTAHESEISITYMSQENQGIAKTLNQLVTSANGHYLVWLASDDYLLEKSISSRVDYLKSHSEKKAVFGDCLVVDDEGKVSYESGIEDLYRGDKGAFCDANSLKKEFICRWGIPGPVLMVERSVYEIIGMYDESLEFEDWDLYLRLAGHELIGFIDERVSAYRWHDKNSCQTMVFESGSKAYRLKVLLKNRHLFSFADRYLIWKKVRKLRRKILRKRFRDQCNSLMGR